MNTSDLFKKAREFLGFSSQNEISKQAQLNHKLINNIETGKTDKPNWDYLKFLVKQGVSPYFLFGMSDEIEGQRLVDCVSKSEHEDLKHRLTELENKLEHSVPRSDYEKLQVKYDALLDVIKTLKNTS